MQNHFPYTASQYRKGRQTWDPSSEYTITVASFTQPGHAIILGTIVLNVKWLDFKYWITSE
jgi:hypothetical protein